MHEALYDCFLNTPYGLKLMFERAGFTDIAVQPRACLIHYLHDKMNFSRADYFLVQN